MDVVLLSIAGLSLVLAIAMGVILFKVLREDRQRSDARVALLTAAAARLDPPPLTDDRALVRDTAVPSVPADLFAVPETASPWGRRAAVAGALATAIAVAGYALMPATTAEPAAAQKAGAQALPLELLSLSHMQQPSGLTITGTVHNPSGAAPVSQVFATAVLFGPDGNFLTSARAPLDLTTLRPGDDSPFVISVPVTGSVARYRVGFRGADGSVIAHVDRRADTTAANTATSGGTPWAH